RILPEEQSRLNDEVQNFDKGKLKKTDTKESNTLPTKEGKKRLQTDHVIWIEHEIQNFKSLSFFFFLPFL
uniref:Thymosin beta 1 n=1 Tax=Salarias fasciatus TaxID=181472 RepID=A0A672J494_SALFA